MTLAMLALDPETAGHLALAIRAHRERLARAGFARPPQLAEIELLAEQVAKSGGAPDRSRQEPTGADTDLTDDLAGPYGGEHELLAQKDAADLLGVAPRSVERMLDRGELRGVTVAGRRRVTRREVEDFAERRAGAPGSDRDRGGAIPR